MPLLVVMVESILWISNEGCGMEYILENVTVEEREILEREGFAWYPDSVDTMDIVIDGDKEYCDMALHAIRRI